MEKRVTLNMVVQRMGDMHTSFEKKMGDLHASLEKRMDRMEINLTSQIDALDERLDRIEITMAEQNHERRIQRLEKHAGFANAA